ncbi:glycoside hydrolase [Candidatus Poribacteria bacterium]|nr:glycoside hydrolase [Candidatus Poribacteria bacterium]
MSQRASAEGEWRAVHTMAPGEEGMPLLTRAVDEVLAPLGVNVLILEVNYGFEYESHPELRGGRPLRRDTCREFAAFCRERSIRLIPQFMCLGHQSWSTITYPLLTNYPEFDETPHIPADNPDIYCRSWCPLHPDVNGIVFPLFDELIDALQADAFHVGLDEVFLIADDGCPRCRGKDPADLFATAVNDYHDRLVGERGLELLMWGDRLLDAATTGYGSWEASENGTAPAIDLIPNDIVICDWHYEPGDDYPSVRYFQEKGFRVLPGCWRNAEAAQALFDCADRDATDRMLGRLCTTWVGGDQLARALLGEPPEPSANAVETAATLRTSMARPG